MRDFIVKIEKNRLKKNYDRFIILGITVGGFLTAFVYTHALENFILLVISIAFLVWMRYEARKEYYKKREK